MWGKRSFLGPRKHRDARVCSHGLDSRSSTWKGGAPAYSQPPRAQECLGTEGSLDKIELVKVILCSLEFPTLNALWEAEAGRSQGQKFKTSLTNMEFETSLANMAKLRLYSKYKNQPGAVIAPVIPATREAEKFLIIHLLKPDSVSSSHSSSVKPCSLADEELRSPVGGEAF
ncbi:hypothetical protein AAY473_012256 [Plecturocebus cupreus]